MKRDSLLNLSPLDGRYSHKLEPLNLLFSEYGFLRARCLVEIRWLEYLAAHPQINAIPPLSSSQRKMLAKWTENFSPAHANAIKRIEKKTVHDVKAVELWLANRLRKNGLGNYSSFVHFGCTSEDINNLAYGLMMIEARDLLLHQLTQIIERLKSRAIDHSHIAMLARTHGQPASPTSLGKEWAVFAYRLIRQKHQLAQAEILGKLNGATGNYSALQLAYPKLNWQKESRSFVESLGLKWNPYTTQIESHDYIAELLHCLVRLNTVLVDLCRDLWGYISLGYFHQRIAKDQVGSSTMPHKINPIDFENSEGNLSFAIAQASYLASRLPLSRWQRDLSDSTLMRNLGSVLGHSLLGYNGCLQGLDKLEVAKRMIVADLDNRWELLTEPLQTLLRQLGEEKAYQKIRKHSQGKTMNYEDYRQMIKQTNLKEAEKNRLLSLKPQDYIGLAAKLAISIKKYKL